MDSIVTNRFSSTDAYRLYKNSLDSLSTNPNNYRDSVTHDLINHNKGLVIPVVDILLTFDYTLEDFESKDEEQYGAIISLITNPYVSEEDKNQTFAIFSDSLVNFLPGGRIKYGLDVGTNTILHGIYNNIDMKELLEKIPSPHYYAERVELYSYGNISPYGEYVINFLRSREPDRS